jgi:putative SOS response-associated peptidase YedK
MADGHAGESASSRASAGPFGMLNTMCNLFSPTPKNDVEVFIRRLVRHAVQLDDHDASKPVGPFGAGPFIRADGDVWRGQVGQWGLIRPGQRERIDHIQPKAAPGRKPPAPRPRSTNNARIEGIDSKPTFAEAWRQGRRCLVPADWYAEPNWETGRNIWWHLKRADGLPWFLAGLWSEWTDPQTGEIVPNFTLLTCNCDGHPLLGRLHKPERDPGTGEVLPAAQQDKRALTHVPPSHWDQWLQGTVADALALVAPAPTEAFDLADALRTDQALQRPTQTGSLF